MERSDRSDKVVLLCDRYSQDSADLHHSLQAAGIDCPVVVIEEEGFLPEGIISVVEYFLGAFEKSADIPGRARYFNEIDIPEYWEITSNGSSGKIMNLSHERGRIFFAEPTHKRLVRCVDWLDENGTARYTDYYNRYGALYARLTYNAKGERFMKSYFSADQKEILVENFVTHDLILNDDGKVFFFKSKLDFVIHFMKKTGFAQRDIYYNSLSTPFFVSESLAQISDGRKGDILFWQEPIFEDAPGNMWGILGGTANRTDKVMVQRRDSYERLIGLGKSKDIVKPLGFAYDFVRESKRRATALICTNSDNIEQLQPLIEALPQLHFNIAALTEMSSKLMSAGKYENVSLFPCVKQELLDELFAESDLYLDINHEAEIVNAVRRAFLNNQLIFGFAQTLHNRDYVQNALIFQSVDYVDMADCISQVLKDEKQFDYYLDAQHSFAMTEDQESYRKLSED